MACEHMAAATMINGVAVLQAQHDAPVKRLSEFSDIVNGSLVSHAVPVAFKLFIY